MSTQWSRPPGPPAPPAQWNTGVPRQAGPRRPLAILAVAFFAVVAISQLVPAGAGGPVASQAAVGRPSPPPTPRWTPTATPTPSAAPAVWALEVADTSFTSETMVGRDVNISITIANTGKAASPATRLQFDGQGDYMDLVGCRPKCEYSDFFGLYLDLPGVPPSDSTTFRVQFLAKAVGVADVMLCVYDGITAGNQVWCGNGSVVIR